MAADCTVAANARRMPPHAVWVVTTNPSETAAAVMRNLNERGLKCYQHRELHGTAPPLTTV
eukprot:5024437-Lingulodinium_polyedra.AAC.1